MPKAIELLSKEIENTEIYLKENKTDSADYKKGWNDCLLYALSVVCLNDTVSEENQNKEV